MVEARPKIGIALSAGAFRGFCHLGVLQVFAEAGIPIDYIAGTSMGAVIGALYAAGLDLKMLIGIAKHLRLKNIIDPTFPRRGLLLGQKVTGLLHLFLRDLTFDQLKVPLAVVATDLSRGTEVVFREGHVVEALRASIAVPGIFTPVYRGNQVLVDGGLVNRVPVSTVRKMGAEVVIAVKIGLPAAQKRLQNVADIILQSFDVMQLQIMACKGQHADIIIEPDVVDFSPARLRNVDRCIQAGAVAARQALPLIKSFLRT